MAHLTVTQRIEIFIFIGCGNKTRTPKSRRYAIYLMKNIQIFLSYHPIPDPITQSTVKTGDVKDLPKSGRPKIIQDKKIDIVLSMEENPQNTSTLVASENELVYKLNRLKAALQFAICGVHKRSRLWGTLEKPATSICKGRG
ncbi:hypothetical protein NQ318_016552 [Aromia moschata]|uniref:Uncharacterized protein n=1 Tax=Aromia moschata TaxID=1265417 RepID=A0AAV8YZ96_9CUCU|nr:hypothetical protein NQ318_016552 [Aromia moschata]